MKIAFEHIRMAFGANEVLHDVSMTVGDGAIFALLGENGAGKSTLMNLLGGMFPPVSGEILLDGKRCRLRSPRVSMKHGIAFIHQELNPVNDLTVYENIFLGLERRRFWGVLDRKAMASEARKILERLGVDIDENAPMRNLDTSRKQIVAIARALLVQAKVLIMDEPTTSLAGHEIDLLFDLVRKLSRDEGVSVIFISHKLNEVKELCDEYAVLRNGSLVASGAVSQVSTEELSELIVGHELASWERQSMPRKEGTVVLEARGLSRGRAFEGVSFQLHSGEILGFTGLLGGGHRELFQSIFGDEPDYQGELFLNGKPFHAKTTANAVASGLAYVPGNRKENAILPDMSVLANGTLTVLPQVSRLGVIRNSEQKALFSKNVGPFRLKCEDIGALVTALSGGNQQKVILARWLSTNPKILILDNPTQGVDIGAKQEIYESICKIAESDVAVLVISGEGQEIQRLCHRAFVMSHGHIVGELDGERLTEGNIMKLATGALSGGASALR